MWSSDDLPSDLLMGTFGFPVIMVPGNVPAIVYYIEDVLVHLE